MLLSSLKEFLDTFLRSLDAVSIDISNISEDKLYLSHKNVQNNANSSFSQCHVLESIRLIMKRAILI